jgi:hypothetical protein
MPTATRSAVGSTAPAPRSRARTQHPLGLRLLVTGLLLAAAAATAPQAASASPSQLSLIQDDRELLGERGEDPAEAMAEIRALGVDVVRTNVIFYKVYRSPGQRRKPADFNAADPSSSHYDWTATDRLVRLAKSNGIQVMLTVTGPGPNFTSASPRRCRKVPCSYRPKPSDFGAFAAAAAKRYRGNVDYYSIWNEPNIGKTWLTPRFQRSPSGRVDVAGGIYRKLFLAGHGAIAKNDPARAGRVLFGETAAIGSPLPLLRAALCLDTRGRSFRGRLAKLHGCSGRVRKLNIGGFAIHPYNQGAYGSPRSRTKTETSLPLGYIPRLHRLINGAVRHGRIGGGKGIFMTEFGFQSKPPDPFGVSPGQQAQFMNESDRLFYSDRRVRAVAQYELVDVPEKDQFNTGLRYRRVNGGTRKPAYDAYRVPLVVTRRSANAVEVYGQVRPARTLAGGASTTVAVQVSQGGGAFQTVAQPRTGARGIFRVNVSRAGASGAKWRLSWQNPGTGEFLTSRVATAGKRLRYFKG